MNRKPIPKENCRKKKESAREDKIPKTECHSLVNAREKRVEEARKLNLLSDTFMSVALDDIPACQHVLRTLTGVKDLRVKEIRTQYRISKLISHDAILDVVAEDEKGKLYNLEIQRTDTVDHARRTRFYGAMLDSEYLKKGKTYEEMPEVHIIYVSEKDLWKIGKTTYRVKKCFEDTDIPYEDGIHVLYVNAAVNDGTDTAKLMEYFKTTDPDDMSQGDLSRRVHFLKKEEGGYRVMCAVTEKWRMEDREEGRKEQARKTTINLIQKGMTAESIAEAVDISVDTVKQWIRETLEES